MGQPDLQEGRYLGLGKGNACEAQMGILQQGCRGGEEAGMLVCVSKCSHGSDISRVAAVFSMWSFRPYESAGHTHDFQGSSLRVRNRPYVYMRAGSLRGIRRGFP